MRGCPFLVRLALLPLSSLSFLFSLSLSLSLFAFFRASFPRLVFLVPRSVRESM